MKHKPHVDKGLAGNFTKRHIDKLIKRIMKNPDKPITVADHKTLMDIVYLADEPKKGD
jgi:hypothetical protein